MNAAEKSWLPGANDFGNLARLLEATQPEDWGFVHPGPAEGRFQPATEGGMGFLNVVGNADTRERLTRLVTVYAGGPVGQPSYAEVMCLGAAPSIEGATQMMKECVRCWSATEAVVTRWSFANEFELDPGDFDLGYLTFLSGPRVADVVRGQFESESFDGGTIVRLVNGLPEPNNLEASARRMALKDLLESAGLLRRQ